MSRKKYIIRKKFSIYFFYRIRRHLRGYYIVLDWCDAMDTQWRDKLELIQLVGPLTTGYIICSIRFLIIRYIWSVSKGIRSNSK
jgi:hypothetical protein